MSKKIQHVGRFASRLSREPLERKFAQTWQEANDHTKTLGYLMGNGSETGHVSARDREVAATVIQWLGSTVGQAFLQEATGGPR